jgi:hypothetical protein
MTEPDEALLYARESAYRKVLEAFGGDETEALAQLETEDAQDVVNWLATTYRAGAAASEARIKALEEALRDEINECSNDECVRCIKNRALLKEADQ